MANMTDTANMDGNNKIDTQVSLFDYGSSRADDRAIHAIYWDDPKNFTESLCLGFT